MVSYSHMHKQGSRHAKLWALFLSKENVPNLRISDSILDIMAVTTRVPSNPPIKVSWEEWPYRTNAFDYCHASFKSIFTSVGSFCGLMQDKRRQICRYHSFLPKVVCGDWTFPLYLNETVLQTRISYFPLMRWRHKRTSLLVPSGCITPAIL